MIYRRTWFGNGDAVAHDRSGDVWATPASPLSKYVDELSTRSLNAYREDPLLVAEHANHEQVIRQGGYGRRQIFELVQNGADQLIDQPRGRITVVLTKDALYCANQGEPVGQEGADALLHAHLSVKRGSEIGRFGLGFKSVLGISSTPQVYSRSGSFGFDADESRKRIAKVVPDARNYPILRVATVLDHAKACAKDPVLADLSSWATTVIRLPLNLPDASWLHEDIGAFPAEFLLFSPHVGELWLEDRTKRLERRLSIRKVPGGYELINGDQPSRWKVFATRHVPSREARQEAGELADRPDLPVIWAVPTGGRVGVGEFWAFFPLQDRTTLSGIINAPWKTNDDRVTLLKSRFNREIIETVADLVVANLKHLQKPKDPAWYLDVMPARGREPRSWGDEVVGEYVYEKAPRVECLPDQEGRLVRPDEVQLHPERASAAALEAWKKHRSAPRGWCHPAVETRDRRPRVERLLSKPAARPVEWLAALMPGRDPLDSAQALVVAAELVKGDPAFTAQISASSILVDDTGKRVPLNASVFLPGDFPLMTKAINLVHPLIAQSPQAVEALHVLGIHEVEPERELDAVVQAGFIGWQSRQWESFWQLVRIVPPSSAVTTLRKIASGREPFRLRTKAGVFDRVHTVLLPGPIVPADGSRDPAVTVDVEYHAKELDVIMSAGAVAAPRPGGGNAEGDVYLMYSSMCRRNYMHNFPSNLRTRPDPDYLEFDVEAFTGPLEPLSRLTEEGRALLTEAILAADPSPAPWTMAHRSVAHYPRRTYEAAVVWYLREEGRLPTSLGIRDVSNCVTGTLRQWSTCLPYYETTDEVAATLDLPDALEKLNPEQWQAAYVQVTAVTDDELLGRFYAAAAKCKAPIPDVVVCRVAFDHRAVPRTDVCVVVDDREFEALHGQDVPLLRVRTADEAETLESAWGLRPSTRLVRTDVVAAESGPPTPLVDQFPALRWVISDELRQTQLVACSELRVETLTEFGKTSQAYEFYRQGDTCFWTTNLDSARLLDVLDQELRLSLTALDRDTILQHRQNEERRKLVADIRSQPDDASRILKAIGPASLRRQLPTALVHAVEELRGPLSDSLIAELGLVVYGVDTLHQFRVELEQAGLEPPQRWAGSRQARKFVRELGFDSVFAGTEQAKRDPLLHVDGPIPLPDLHPYQREITKKIRHLLQGDERNRRGLLSLPTGAGKTRIAVQALVEAVVEDGLGSPILWVAQSDELCEQAVQAWTEVWRSLGPRHQLHLSRLWASNEAEPLDSGTHVVVATIDKLRSACFEDPDYDWLAEATVLVIDEAHTVVAASYNDLLEWQGVGTHGRLAARCPLLGLTATPFRGSEEETSRLATRFGKLRLDASLGPDPYKTLQDLNVLAKVQHELIEGVDPGLTASEAANLRKLKTLPASVYDRLGSDTRRNAQLLDHVLRLPRDWPILLFATSVEHAQTMAALLQTSGVPAAPISADTDPGVRRHYVDAFKAGRLRVLTNYNVLAQGFDAPAVRAIYVARPVFTASRYQQMIGRGLRGELNGGKKECLIVNVQDNFTQYGERLAFYDFEYLWSPRDSER